MAIRRKPGAKRGHADRQRHNINPMSRPARPATGGRTVIQPGDRQIGRRPTRTRRWTGWPFRQASTAAAPPQPDMESDEGIPLLRCCSAPSLLGEKRAPR